MVAPGYWYTDPFFGLTYVGPRVTTDNTSPVFECPECGADLSIATHAFGCGWPTRNDGKFEIMD